MNSNKLKGKMIEKSYTQKNLAKELGITPQSLNAKINKRSQFTLDEVVKIISILDIDNPMEIFFTKIAPNMQRRIS